MPLVQSIAKKRVAGPPIVLPQDQMMENVTAPRVSEEDVKPEMSVKDIVLPLVVSQIADLVSTENLTRKKGDPRFSVEPGSFEQNPLPGMDSGAGRVGWGALETALMTVLAKKKPGVAKHAARGMSIVHQGLARGNSKMADDFDRYKVDNITAQLGGLNSAR